MDKENTTENKLVHTYAEDMAGVLENDREGLIKKIIHGEEEHETEKMNLSPESKKNQVYMFISVVFLAIGFSLVAFFLLRTDVKTVAVAPQFIPLIFNDKSTYLEVAGQKREEIIQTVRNEIVTSDVKSGGVEGIYLTENKSIIGLRRLLSVLKSSFAPDASKVLVSDNFLMGLVKSGTSETVENAFFILIKMRSNLDIFISMKAWENKMLLDIHEMLGVELNSGTNYIFKKNFEDGIVENKNARILYDKDGNVVLMYVFANDTSVIITNSQNAAKEIILRLASSNTKQ